MEITEHLRQIEIQEEKRLIDKYKKQTLNMLGKNKITKQEEKMLDDILTVFYKSDFLFKLETHDRMLDNFKEQQEVMSNEAKDLACKLERQKDVADNLKFMIKVLKDSIYTHKQLILEYQKQLHIETIVDFYD